MNTRLIKVEICYEHDVVLSRQRARQVAALIGFNAQDQVRIATAVSEIARNTYRYGGRGKMELFIQRSPKPLLTMVFTDQGPGIADLETILAGKYKSKTGMGVGLVGATRLMDNYRIDTNANGTTVTLEQTLPNGRNELNQEFFKYLTDQLSQQTSQEPFVEIQQQNQELLCAFSELEKRQNELARLNLEILEAKQQLRQQNEELESRVTERTADLKDSLRQMERFCYSIAHDLKAPLRAINGLTRILREDYESAFDAAGKDCTHRIVKAATRMDILIRDLLDFGQLTHVDVLLSSVNLNEGISKAMDYLNSEIVLTKATIEVPTQFPVVLANPVLLHQVLCNIIENALKFVEKGVAPCVKISVLEGNSITENGTVTRTARIQFQDNGIGVAAAYNQRIFKVFERLHGDNSAYEGTGIGLALVQKAMDRMNGFVGVESTLNQGSLFWIELPNG
ncbi:MAG: ATP-binding protein [Verrucomicrobia bacterium]|nr:ATP-binding protein [Verrucomicrobiota bacterium]